MNRSRSQEHSPAFSWYELGVKVRAFQLRAQGFTGVSSKEWMRKVDHNRKTTSVPAFVRRRAIRAGFLPETLERHHIDTATSQVVSEKDYAFLHPYNGKYGKWVSDRISTLKIFAPYAKWFQPTHFHLFFRDRELHAVPMSDTAQQYAHTLDGVASLLARVGELTLHRAVWEEPQSVRLQSVNGALYIDGTLHSTEEFIQQVLHHARKGFVVVAEPIHSLARNGLTTDRNNDEFTEETASLSIILMNPVGNNPTIAEARLTVRPKQHGSYQHEPVVVPVNAATGAFTGGMTILDTALVEVSALPETGIQLTGTVRDWDLITHWVETLARFAPQLEFIELTVSFTAEGPRITSASPSPSFPEHTLFSEGTQQYLQDRLQRKLREHHSPLRMLKRWLRNARFTIRKNFARLVYPAGLVPYQSVKWPLDVARDFFNRNGVPLTTKLWAYRHGLLSYRVPQYGITKENRTQYISDFRYRWLRHINGKYRYWLEDKVSIKYVAAEFNDVLPAYYFYTRTVGDHNTVVPMMDCPPGYEASFEDILRLARERRVLALKPDEGSHGAGFYRLSYDAEQFFLNNAPASEQDVLNVLTDPKNHYLVTEFIEMHPELARIYPDSVNTIRMIVFKRDGVTSTLGTSYLRIGSRKSGFVDNTAVGGMLAEINEQTGEYGNAQMLIRGRVVPSPNHPDTGVLISGVIPHWDEVKRRVLQIADSLAELEYLGFDVAITSTGFKLPEINRSPDYPRISKLTPATTEYLFDRLRNKQKHAS